MNRHVLEAFENKRRMYGTPADVYPQLADFMARKAEAAGLTVNTRLARQLDALLSDETYRRMHSLNLLEDRIERAWQKLQTMPWEYRQFCDWGIIPSDLFDEV